MTLPFKGNLKGFIERWHTHGEAFAWEVLKYGEVGHDPPWHIVNDSSWRGPMEVPRDKGVNEALCANERTGYTRKLSRGRKGSVPHKNEFCGECRAIILKLKDEAESPIKDIPAINRQAAFEAIKSFLDGELSVVLLIQILIENLGKEGAIWITHRAFNHAKEILS
jgi:hypothetical protein